MQLNHTVLFFKTTTIFGMQQKCFIHSSYFPQLFSNPEIFVACQALVCSTSNGKESIWIHIVPFYFLYSFYSSIILLLSWIDMHTRIPNTTLCNIYKVFCRLDSWINIFVMKYVLKISMNIFQKRVHWFTLPSVVYGSKFC